MKKHIYTKEVLQKTAEKLFFARNADLSVMLATEDGNFFYPDHLNHAKAHAKGAEVYVLPRSVAPSPSIPKGQGVAKSTKAYQKVKAKLEASAPEKGQKTTGFND